MSDLSDMIYVFFILIKIPNVSSYFSYSIDASASSYESSIKSRSSAKASSLPESVSILR